MEKFITSNGCALRIADTLTGERCVVLLHGYLESLDTFDEFTYLLSPAVRVVSIDLPGHGISEVKGEVHTMEFLADTVAGVMDCLNIERAVVVGHSMGGYVALEMLNRHSERMCGIVLMHATPYADTEEKHADRLREIELVKKGHKELIAKAAPERRFAEANRKRLADDIEGAYEQAVLTEDEGMIALINGMAQRADRNETLRTSRVKAMFLFSHHDDLIATEKAERTAADHPEAKTVWLDGSGHMCFIEQPAETAEAILRFVDECCEGGKENEGKAEQQEVDAILHKESKRQIDVIQK